MQRSPRHCAGGAFWFLIISRIKVRFILSFLAATDSRRAREAREYAQSRGDARLPDRRNEPPMNSGREAALPRPHMVCPEYYFRAIRIRRHAGILPRGIVLNAVPLASLPPLLYPLVSNFRESDRVGRAEITVARVRARRRAATAGTNGG